VGGGEEAPHVLPQKTFKKLGYKNSIKHKNRRPHLQLESNVLFYLKKIFLLVLFLSR
jgi:hypothetical protein